MEHPKQRLSTFLFSMLLGCAASFAIYPLLVSYVFLAPPDVRWAEATYVLKDRLLGEARKPRVIFVGGSNVLFGISAREFEAQTGLPAFNYGVHAGLGLQYILHRAERVVSAGDVVILSPEYDILFPGSPDSDQVSDVQAEYLLHYDRPYIFTLPLKSILHELYGLGINGLMREMAFSGGAGKTAGFTPINRWGDETLTDPGQPLEKIPLTDPPLTLQKMNSPRAYVGQFLDDMKARNVQVFFAWPGHMDEPLYHTESYERQFTRLQNAVGDLGVPILGGPEDFFFDPRYVYDTTYHPLDPGRKARTKLLARLICAQDLGNMKCTELR